MRHSFRLALRDFVSLGAALVVLSAARSSLADHYTVPTGSMQPTVEPGSRVVVDKAAYGLRVPFSSWALSPRQMPVAGDVVVALSPEDGRVLLKRVAAVEGDRVRVRRGRLTVNGRPESTSGSASVVHGGGPDFGPTVVPAGMLLLMGDNRGNSHDGRSFGWISKQAVLGRALGVYWDDGPTWSEL